MRAAEQHVPFSRQIIGWLLLWPALCLVARQAPYFAGPARDAATYVQGAAAGAGSDYHATLYFNALLQAGFAFVAWRRIWQLLKQNPLIVLGLVVVLMSALWSGAPDNTVRLWASLTLVTLFSCYLFVRMPPERLMHFFMFVGVAAALLSILFVVMLPSYGVFVGYGGGAWQGICDHKNTLGLSMAYLLTPVFFVERCRRWQKVSYAVLLLFLIVMSQSRGAWLYTCAALCFIGFLALVRRFRRHEAMVAVLLGVLATVALVTAAAYSLDVVAPLLGKSASMSGRTDIYREAWRSIMKAPLTGYGYGAFWKISPEAARIGLSIGWTNIGYSESGLLELALQIGFVGVAAVIAMIGRALFQGVKLLQAPFYSPAIGWYMSILFLAVLTNVDAGWLMVPNTLDWVLILIACMGLGVETRNAARRKAQSTPASRPEILEAVA